MVRAQARQYGDRPAASGQTIFMVNRSLTGSARNGEKNAAQARQTGAVRAQFRRIFHWLGLKVRLSCNSSAVSDAASLGCLDWLPGFRYT
ncbi:MAG: hypothetical protein WA418_30920 [Bradyrhizobium sp.]